MTVPRGWGTWEEDRRYPSKRGDAMIVVYKRTQNYGDGEKVFWKNERKPLTRGEREYLEGRDKR